MRIIQASKIVLPSIVCIAAWILPQICTAAAKPPRPNILFAFADDWGRQASAYARLDGAGGINDVVSTPNFDQLATAGVLFRNAFVNAPSCTPCRSSLLFLRSFAGPKFKLMCMIFART